MKTSNQKIERTLQNALTVGDLRRMLEGFDEDAPVVFACDYGDYHHTTQALLVGDVEERSARELAESGYSRSGLALRDGGDEDGDAWLCENCDEEWDCGICPKCGNPCVDEDGDEYDDEADRPIVVIR